MAKAVVGIFDSSAEAQQAVRNLESIGITRDHVEITERTGIEPENQQKDEGLTESISHFFSNLFGNEDDEARNYTEVANRGCTVTVYAVTREEAESAADVLDDCGAIDVTERANKYRNEMGTSSGMTGSNLGTSGSSSGTIAGATTTGMPGTSGTSRDRIQDDLGSRMEGTSGDSSATGTGRISDMNSGMDIPGTDVPDQWSNQRRPGGTRSTSSLGDDFSEDLDRTGSDNNVRVGNEWNEDLSTSRGIVDPGSDWEDEGQRKPGDLNTGVPGGPMSGAMDSPTGGMDTGPSSDDSETRTNSRIRRSRIFETPDDIRNRGGRVHPSAANRNTTGDINPLNQQNPGSTGYNPNL